MGSTQHNSQWRVLQSRIEAEKVPHAILLSGPAHVGKLSFAREFASALLCDNPHPEHKTACGECSACGLFAAGSHSDYIEVSPEEDSRVIKIQQIRDLCEELSLTAQHGGNRIAVIYPADVMHTAASNSLLKTLEEPRPGVTIVLVSSKLGAIPVTIRSRCQRLRLNALMPSRTQMQHGESDIDFGEQWHQGVMGHADYLSLSGDWSKLDHEPVFRAIFHWQKQSLRSSFGDDQTKMAAVENGNNHIPQETATLEQQQLLGFYDKLLSAYQFAARPGVNRRALYEQLFIEAASMRAQLSRSYRVL